MAQPLPYERDYDFEAFQSGHPETPLPGNKVNLELDQVAETLDQVLDRIKRLQRDDLALANKSVGYDQLADEVSLGFNAPEPWETAHAYVRSDSVFEDNGFYRCEVAHTSGTFATDLAAGNWSLVADFSAATSDAEAAQAAAEAAQASAESARDTAVSSKDTAVTSAANAATSGDNAALSSASASGFATAASSSASAASASQSAAASSESAASGYASAAASSASDASDSADDAAASAAGVDLPAVTADTMLVDNAAGDAREAKTFSAVKTLLGLATVATSGDYDDLTNKPLPAPASGDASKQLYVKTDHSGYVLAQQSFDTIALAEAVTIPTVLDRVTTLNRGTGDGGSDTDAVEIEWERVSSVPSHGRYFLDASSAIFSIITRVPDLFQFGGTTNGSPSGANIEALQSGLTYCASRSLGTLEIPNGSFVFDEQPGDISDYGPAVHIKGQGMYMTNSYKTFNAATDNKGLFHWTEGHPHLSGMSIIAATGSSGGAAFAVVPTAESDAVGYSRFQEINITSGPLDGWAFAFLIDGRLRTTPAKGVRDISLDQVYAFGSEYGVYIYSVTNFSWHHGFLAQETGAGNASANLTMLGVSGSQPSDGISVVMQYVAGTLNLAGYNNNGIIQAGKFGGISNTASETNMLVIGPSTTAAQTNWPSNCRHISSFRQDSTLHGLKTGVDIAGTSLSFGRTFVSPPGMQVSPSGGIRKVGFGSVTTTGCTLYAELDDTTVSWTASGTLAD